jgi:drug/metabolite transporter superfamily protein YnfA
MGILPVLVLLAGKMPAPQEILGYFFNWKSIRERHKKIIQSCGMGILPVLVLLAGKMPAPQEILGYFFNWKSIRERKTLFFLLPSSFFLRVLRSFVVH